MSKHETRDMQSNEGGTTKDKYVVHCKKKSKIARLNVVRKIIRYIVDKRMTQIGYN
jgi:hypothetical protein